MFWDFLIYLSAFIGLFAVIFYTLNLRGRLNVKEPVFPEKNPPSVSIIIPAYNEEKGIATTIDSALGIDYPKNKFEIIVVDDGSKDKTYKIASKYKSNIVKVFTKINGGKGTALNYGIKRAKGEFIVTMDADSVIMPDALKNQIARFNNPKVMCVSPIVAIYEPKNILERIQQIEYLLGVFLREAFASLDSVHITPGAFSAYRKSFFEKYGYFAVNNLTEDFEMALRIQYNNFSIENSTKSIVYTHPPKTFRALLVQRKRWYIGLIQNLRNYKSLFSKNYGALGMVVLPTAVVTITISVILTIYALIRTLLDVKQQLLLLDSISFNFANMFEFIKYSSDNFLFKFFSNPMTLFFIVFCLITFGYMIFAKKKVKKYSNVKISLPLFMMGYMFLFAFWWTVALIYHLFDRKVSWR